MAARKFRSIIARFVVVAGLAVALFVGSAAAFQPAGASAMPQYTCEQAFTLGEIWYAYGQVMFSLGQMTNAAAAWGKAAAYFDYC
jgi:hypothetical protein